MLLIFVIGPTIIHLTIVNPLLDRMSAYQDRIQAKKAGVALVSNAPAPASDQEWAQLEEIKDSELSRLKKVDSRKSLLQFSGALADALASDAQSYGLKVTGVDIDNALIKATYVPSEDQAMERLASLPGVQWPELKDPLAIPMRHLPSLDIQMTVVSEYSKVFSFIEALPEFPVPVVLTNLGTVDGPQAKAFRLKFRGYYYSPGQVPVELQASN